MDEKEETLKKNIQFSSANFVLPIVAILSLLGFILLGIEYPHYYTIYVGLGFAIILAALLGVVWISLYTSQSLAGGVIGISVTVFLIAGILLAQSRLGKIETNDKAEEQEVQLEASRERLIEVLRAFKVDSTLTNEQIQRLVNEQAEETEDSKHP